MLWRRSNTVIEGLGCVDAWYGVVGLEEFKNHQIPRGMKTGEPKFGRQNRRMHPCAVEGLLIN